MGRTKADIGKYAEVIEAKIGESVVGIEYASEFLQASKRTVMKRVSDKKLRVIKFRNVAFFRVSDLETLLSNEIDIGE